MTTEFYPTACPTTSPWGPVQDGSELAPGIWHVSTAGHGGIKLSARRLEAMPCYMLQDGHFAHQRVNGWFEEDCDWSLVALVFPEAFHGLAAGAHATAKRYQPAAYARFTAESAAAA